MNSFIILGIVVFAISFAGVYYVNYTAETPYSFTPPYYFSIGDMMSQINAFLFVFIVSAAFFGLAVPIALGIEGLKYASLLSTASMPAFDLLFAIPQLFAAYSASLLGQGAVEDYQGRGSVFAYWSDSVKWFVVGAVMLGILWLARPYF